MIDYRLGKLAQEKRRAVLSKDLAMVKQVSKTLTIKEDYEKIHSIVIHGNCVQEENYYFKFNQQIRKQAYSVVEENGLTITRDGNGAITISGVSTAYTTVSFGASKYVYGHKYFGKSGIKDGMHAASNSNLPFFFVNYGYIEQETTEPIIFTSDENTNMYNLIYIGPGKDFTTPVTIKPMCIDLTEMYGEGYEPNDSWEVEAHFPNEYYEYNEGSLIKEDETIFPYAKTKYKSPSVEILEEIKTLAEGQLNFFRDDIMVSFGIDKLELYKVGEVSDTLVIDKLGARVIKRIGKIDSYNGENIITNFISTTGEKSFGATIYYVLEQPIVTELTNETDKANLNAILEYNKNYSLQITNEPVGQVLNEFNKELYYFARV